MTGTPDEEVPASQRPNIYRLTVTAAITLVIIATLVYWLFEDWTFVDSLYFSVIAVTTVGFGDLTPTTNLTKLFTIVYVLAGVTLVGLALSERLRRHHEALAWIALHARRERLEGPDEPADSDGSQSNRNDDQP